MERDRKRWFRDGLGKEMRKKEKERGGLLKEREGWFRGRERERERQRDREKDRERETDRQRERERERQRRDRTVRTKKLVLSVTIRGLSVSDIRELQIPIRYCQ